MSIVLICDSDWHDEPYVLDFETGYEEVAEGEHLCDYCLERKNRPPREPSQFERLVADVWDQKIKDALEAQARFVEFYPKIPPVRNGDTIVFTKYQTIT